MMTRALVWLAAAGLLAAAGCAGSRPGDTMSRRYTKVSPPDVRVGLLVSVDEVQVGADESYALVDEDGVLVVGLPTEVFNVRQSDAGVEVYTAGGELVALAEGGLEVEPRTRRGFITVNGARYPGRLHLRPGARPGLNVINVVDVETYLKGVVPLEIGHQGAALLEAAKAQAVAARTYVASHMGQYPDEGFDLHSGVLDQVYGPADRHHPDSDRAVDETRGIILTHEGSPIRANYSSTCGGKTAAVNEGFDTEPIPYLRAHADRVNGRDACRSSKYFRWEQTWNEAELLSVLERTVPRELGRPWTAQRLLDLKVAKSGDSGRVIDLEIVGDLGSVTVSRGMIRRVLETPKGRPLRSTAFEMEIWRRDAGGVKVVMLRGRGWGHGVGMCQWGAMQLSRDGHDYRKILSHYYPGTKFTPWFIEEPLGAHPGPGKRSVDG